MRLRSHATSPLLLVGAAAIGIVATGPFAGCGGNSVDTTTSGSGGSGGTSTASTTTASTTSSSTASTTSTTSSTASSTGSTGGAGGTGTSSTSSGGSTKCGNGTVDSGEQCDDGNTINGDGCNNDCTFSCVSTDPTTCAPPDSCQGTSTCSDATHTCSASTPVADGTVCATGTCKSGVCTSVTCGDGVRDPGEQCDDGNTTNLDGCDSSCKFEQSQRVNYLQMQWATDTVCTANALGGSVATVAQSTLQTSLDSGIADGSISVLFKFVGLDDLTGTNDSVVAIGPLNATPITTGSATYSGTSDLDWWYKVDPLSIDASRKPLSLLSGNITANTLTAGPGNLSLTLNLAGTPAPLVMSGAVVTGSIGATSAPLASTGTPPGHLAAEHLDPALVSFASSGQATDTGAAELCGNVSAASLAKVPVPTDLATGGAAACTQGYSATANSILDVFVGGCTIIVFQAITPTQPDKVDPAAPLAGAGGPYKFTMNNAHHVTGCTDKNNASATLATCLAGAGYSSFFKFTSDRVIVK